MIPKTENPKTKDYRPITLLNATYKLVTSVIDARLRKHQEQYNYMRIDQRGCTTGSMGCIDNLLIDKGVLEDITKQRNSESTKQLFFPTFFLEHRNSQRNKFSWYCFCWDICGICKEGLQTWMSQCTIDSLDKQPGWKLSLSLVEKHIQTKVSYSYCCILSEKRRNLTQIKIQTFADAKLFGRRYYREKTGHCSLSPLTWHLLRSLLL